MQTTNEGNQASKNPKKSYLSKVCYVFFGLTIAFVLVFIFWKNQSNKRLESEFAMPPIPPPSTLDAKDNNTCPVWSFVGDGYCDDEANVPECGYDFNDCMIVVKLKMTEVFVKIALVTYLRTKQRNTRRTIAKIIITEP